MKRPWLAFLAALLCGVAVVVVAAVSPRPVPGALELVERMLRDHEGFGSVTVQSTITGTNPKQGTSSILFRYTREQNDAAHYWEMLEDSSASTVTKLYANGPRVVMVGIRDGVEWFGEADAASCLEGNKRLFRDVRLAEPAFAGLRDGLSERLVIDGTRYKARLQEIEQTAKYAPHQVWAEANATYGSTEAEFREAISQAIVEPITFQRRPAYRIAWERPPVNLKVCDYAPLSAIIVDQKTGRLMKVSSTLSNGGVLSETVTYTVHGPPLPAETFVYVPSRHARIAPPLPGPHRELRNGPVLMTLPSPPDLGPPTNSASSPAG